MMASTDTIEKLKRQFADSWSSSDDKENSDYDTATRLGSKSEPMSPIHFTWNEIQSADQSPSYRCSADDRLGGGSIFTLTPSSKSYGRERGRLKSPSGHRISQMDFNASLLEQVGGLESSTHNSHEKFHFLESDLVQLRTALRISSDQTQLLEKKLASAAERNAEYCRENRQLKEEVNCATIGAVCGSTQAEAQKRRLVRVEEGSSAQAKKLNDLENMLSCEKDKNKEDITGYVTTSQLLENAIKKMEESSMETKSTCGGYEEQLRESRAENLRHHKHVEHLAERLQAEQQENGVLSKENRTLDLRFQELSRSYQECRVALVEREEVNKSLAARERETSLAVTKGHEEAALAETILRQTEELLRCKVLELWESESRLSGTNKQLESAQMQISALENQIQGLGVRTKHASVRVYETVNSAPPFLITLFVLMFLTY